MADYPVPSYLPYPPNCIFTSRTSLLPWVSDDVLGTFLPTLVYIVASAVFHIIGQLDLLSHYRIHPANDDLKRNHVSRFRCLRGVIRYHIMQIAVGLLLIYGAEPEKVGNHQCGIHEWAVIIRTIHGAIPGILALVGLDARGIAFVLGQSPMVRHFLGSNDTDSGQERTSSSSTAGFSRSQLALASFMAFVIVPATQFFVALVVVDTWVYFTHRLCHINKTLYRIVHSQHHQLYVSYAFGAVYAHWLESFFLDILSFVMANAIARLSVRQSMTFGSLATLKTISDHCGYVFPWDPFLYLNRNGASFHDLHHQSWGFKHNFSTYTAFWDSLLGTEWNDLSGASQRYSRTSKLMEARVTHDQDCATEPAVVMKL